MEYQNSAQKIFLPSKPILHRDSEYRETGFKVLLQMQRDHFWYRGRHRFIASALKKFASKEGLSAIDLGGGCGGWVQYLSETCGSIFNELAMGDSCLPALAAARTQVPQMVSLYHCDILNLYWESRWDVAFLLDVIEHLPDDVEILRKVGQIMRPGGLIFVTAPALDCFWSYNDELGHHLRRYNKRRLVHVASQANLELLDSRYFMFLLSPLYALARWRSVSHLTEEQKLKLIIKQHETPPRLLNSLLTGIFNLESYFGHSIQLPWGTSILAVLRKK